MSTELALEELRKTCELRMVAGILGDPFRYVWSIQGFGMLRLHLSDSLRMNIWHSGFRVPNVSMMHTHPWHFTSSVVVGRLENIRYLPSVGGDDYDVAVIKPGPGGGLVENFGRMQLAAQRPEVYERGAWYRQMSHEIHVSSPADGTVTLNWRERVGEDLAYVYWPSGTQWVSAEPRRARAAEIEAFTNRALEWLA